MNWSIYTIAACFMMHNGVYSNKCECYGELARFLPKDMISIIQEYVHESRVGRYPIKEIRMKSASIGADNANISKIRIRMDVVTIGILKIQKSYPWDVYIDQLDELFAMDNARIYDEQQILAKINWSVYNQYPPRIFLPLLQEFYRQEKNLFAREIHGLSYGISAYMIEMIDRIYWENTCWGSGSAGLRYSD